VANPTYQNVVTFGAIALASYLNNKGIGFLLQYGIPAAIGTTVYNLPTFCAADPPVLSCPSSADILNWFNPLNPAGALQLRKAMENLVSAFLWYDLCECSDGSHPAPPAACAAPAGTQLNPPVLTAPPVAATCASNNQPSSIFAASPQTNAVFSAGTVAIPAGASSVEVDLIATLIGQATTVQLQFKTAGGAVIQTITEGVIAVAGPGFVMREPVPIGAAELDIIFTWAGAQAAARYTWVAGMFCQGALPSAPAAPCCPPDPQQQAMLSQILQLISGMYGQINLNPPGWITTQLTTGIHDNHEIVLQANTIAVDINLTTIPTQLGRTNEDVAWYSDVGWVALYNGVGQVPLGKIGYKLQHFVTPPAAFRVIEISLHPGVIADVYERGAAT